MRLRYVLYCLLVGGHFGPTDASDMSNITYHYHSTTYTPYHLACQGPALGQCSRTQNGVDFCGPGCGAEVCAQPGTKKVCVAAVAVVAVASGLWWW